MFTFRISNSKPRTRSFSLFVTTLCIGLVASACGYESSSSAARRRVGAPAIPPAAPLTPDAVDADAGIRMLEERVKRDPEDFGAHNKLAGFYLQRARETGGADYINLAARAARLSLESVPEMRNTGGLAALTQAEFASHEFIQARDHAIELTALDAGKTYPYALLGDAHLELGDYEAARKAFRHMERVGGGISHSSETRRSRLAFLHGDTAGATRHLMNALALALDLPAPPREPVAWYRWQLGELAFSAGDYERAERHYREALITFPDYFRAVAGLGRVRAAHNDINGAIEHYEKVVNRLPDPAFVAMLGDFYKLAGRETESNAQYKLVEQIAQLNSTNGVIFSRQLMLFYADHDMKAQEAYVAALKEYETRRDIYGADAVAWTALKAGKLDDAQKFSRAALRLGTQDAILFYHAGMIARAAGDKTAARNHIQRALKLNPQFDLLQASIAKQALDG